MKKQKIKKSEARVLVYLDNAILPLKYARSMSVRLGIEYGFLIQRLKEMEYKGWITSTTKGTKRYYIITTKAPMEQAKRLLADE